MGRKKKEDSEVAVDLAEYDQNQAKQLFYESDSIKDKKRALEMSAPYFRDSQSAAMIITDAACGRCGSTDSALIQYANTVIYESIAMYINKLIHTYFNTYVCTGDVTKNRELTETLHSCAFIQCMNDLEKYDATQSKPITFFHQRILFGLSSYLMDMTGAPSRAYGLQMKRVKRAQDAIRHEGLKPDLALLQERLPDLKIEQIDNALNLIQIHSTLQSMDSEDFQERPSGFETPEEAVIKKDAHRTACEGLSSLPELERNVLCMSFGISPRTYEAIAATGMTQKAIAEKLGISQEQVKQKKSIALNKMREYYKTQAPDIKVTDARHQNDEYTDHLLSAATVPFTDADDEDEELQTICRSVIAIGE